jgi:hypothetical protein
MKVSFFRLERFQVITHNRRDFAIQQRPKAGRIGSSSVETETTLLVLVMDLARVDWTTPFISSRVEYGRENEASTPMVGRWVVSLSFTAMVRISTRSSVGKVLNVAIVVLKMKKLYL